jgi:hypothetical protein
MDDEQRAERDTLFDLPVEPIGTVGPTLRGRPRLQRPDRDQVRLRAASLDELLPADHRARLVWAFVERLDLSALHARIRAVEGHSGRPPIDPAILVALWLYATLDGVGSARELARLVESHDAYRWIAGGVGVNHHTLADIRAGDADLLEDLLVQSVATLTLAETDEAWTVAQDGVRVRASAGAGSFHRRDRLTDALADAELRVRSLRAELDADPNARSRRQAAAAERAAAQRAERVRRALEALPGIEAVKRRNGRDPDEARASSTDPDARVMRMGDGGWRPAFNVQYATEVGTGLVCGVAVTSVGSDQGELVPMQARLRRCFGRVPDALVVDGGFASLEGIEHASAGGSTVFAPPTRPRDGSRDPFLPLPDDPVAVAAWRVRMGTEAGKAVYRTRGRTAEWVNALARNRGLQQLRVRGAERVRAAVTWFAIAHNVLQADLLRRRAAGTAP